MTVDLQLMAKVAGSILTIFTFWKVVVRPTYRAFASIKKTADMLEVVLPTLHEIHEEFRPNGGTSLRDVLDRLDRDMARRSALTHAALDAVTCAGLLECDEKGGVVWASTGWEILTGRPAESALGYGWAEAIHPDDRIRVSEAWEWCQKHLAPFSETFRYQRPNGTIVDVYGRATPVTIEGTLVAWSAAVRPSSARCFPSCFNLRDIEEK